jgi:hypothetical protein
MTDIEQAFNEICDQLGCAYDNEAALFAIDKLQKSAQSDTEPVAWQWRLPNQDWPELSCGKAHAEYMRDKGAEIRPLFAAPPRPDASAEPYCGKNINAKSEWLKGEYIPIGGAGNGA